MTFSAREDIRSTPAKAGAQERAATSGGPSFEHLRNWAPAFAGVGTY